MQISEHRSQRVASRIRSLDNSHHKITLFTIFPTTNCPNRNIYEDLRANHILNKSPEGIICIIWSKAALKTTLFTFFEGYKRQVFIRSSDTDVSEV